MCLFSVPITVLNTYCVYSSIHFTKTGNSCNISSPKPIQDTKSFEAASAGALFFFSICVENSANNWLLDENTCDQVQPINRCLAYIIRNTRRGRASLHSVVEEGIRFPANFLAPPNLPAFIFPFCISFTIEHLVCVLCFWKYDPLSYWTTQESAAQRSTIKSRDLFQSCTLCARHLKGRTLYILKYQEERGNI